jgi:hypothetical protein
VALEALSRQVVDVDVRAGRDVDRGEPDDLAVLANRLAAGDGTGADLVAVRDLVDEDERAARRGDRRPGRERLGRDRDVVTWVQNDEIGHGRLPGKRIGPGNDTPVGAIGISRRRRASPRST